MKWLKSLFTKAPPTEDATKLDAAHEMGRKAASAMVGDLDAFIASRFGHIKSAYLKVLDDGLLRVRALPEFEHSPILLARAELSAYYAQVKDLEPKMTAEILDHMQEWQGVFDSMGLDGEIERVTKARLDELFLNMTLGGLSQLLEHTDQLKILDDAWRAANPAQSALEPIE